MTYGVLAASPALAAALDDALGGGGRLICLTPHHGPEDGKAAELLAQLRHSDVSASTVADLHTAVADLCCRYGREDAVALHAESVHWLRTTQQLLGRPVGVLTHRELVTASGWLALLVGCLEYDMQLHQSAETTRRAALRLAHEAEHADIAAWAWEMRAWFALTQGRLPEVVAAAETGQALVRTHPTAVQLAAQAAKAYARMGDVAQVHATLAYGRRVLDQFPHPERPDHHFTVDPDKWDFYAMDAYRLVGENDLADEHARRVLEWGTAPDGTERAPMRMAEARLTLGTVAARTGHLEQAVTMSLDALHARRRSMPSLLMVANETQQELDRRDPRSGNEFRAALREILSDS